MNPLIRYETAKTALTLASSLVGATVFVNSYNYKQSALIPSHRKKEFFGITTTIFIAEIARKIELLATILLYGGTPEVAFRNSLLVCVLTTCLWAKDGPFKNEFNTLVPLAIHTLFSSWASLYQPD